MTDLRAMPAANSNTKPLVTANKCFIEMAQALIDQKPNSTPKAKTDQTTDHHITAIQTA